MREGTTLKKKWCEIVIANGADFRPYLYFFLFGFCEGDV